MKKLTYQQREAIRQLHDTKSKDTIHKRTFGSLVRHGYATEAGALTDKGNRAHQMIMSTGDGPEYLKSLLSF